MKLKIWITVLAFLTIVNAVALGTFLFVHFTQGPVAPELRRPGFRRTLGEGRSPGLRFRSEEREQLKTLMHDFRSETRDLRRQAHAIENEVFDQMQEDPVDRAAVDSLLDELSVVRLEISKKATENLLEAKEFLSPQQQKTFYRAILGERPGGRGERRGPR
jgi:Spy/CpxP family protein refolding chaperone